MSKDEVVVDFGSYGEDKETKVNIEDQEVNNKKQKKETKVNKDNKIADKVVSGIKEYLESNEAFKRGLKRILSKENVIRLFKKLDSNMNYRRFKLYKLSNYFEEEDPEKIEAILQTLLNEKIIKRVSHGWLQYNK